LGFLKKIAGKNLSKYTTRDKNIKKFFRHVFFSSKIQLDKTAICVQILFEKCIFLLEN